MYTPWCVRVWISCLSNTKSLSRCITAVCRRVQRRCWIRPDLQHTEDWPNLKTNNGAVHVNTHPAYTIHSNVYTVTVTCDGHITRWSRARAVRGVLMDEGARGIAQIECLKQGRMFMEHLVSCLRILGRKKPLFPCAPLCFTTH